MTWPPPLGDVARRPGDQQSLVAEIEGRAEGRSAVEDFILEVVRRHPAGPFQMSRTTEVDAPDEWARFGWRYLDSAGRELVWPVPGPAEGWARCRGWSGVTGVWSGAGGRSYRLHEVECAGVAAGWKWDPFDIQGQPHRPRSCRDHQPHKAERLTDRFSTSSHAREAAGSAGFDGRFTLT
jgi:hypothetical protein